MYSDFRLYKFEGIIKASLLLETPTEGLLSEYGLRETGFTNAGRAEGSKMNELAELTAGCGTNDSLVEVNFVDT